uniref:Uncharacterized protein n=1 Tax=Anopheles dirus TaxID=7168 RepID=A0A182NYX7_9DIPT
MKLWKSKKGVATTNSSNGTTTTSCVPGSGGSLKGGMLAKTCKFSSSSNNS